MPLGVDDFTRRRSHCSEWLSFVTPRFQEDSCEPATGYCERPSMSWPNPRQRAGLQFMEWTLLWTALDQDVVNTMASTVYSMLMESGRMPHDLVMTPTIYKSAETGQEANVPSAVDRDITENEYLGRRILACMHHFARCSASDVVVARVHLRPVP